MDFPPFSSANIRRYCVVQYHVPTEIGKSGCFSLVKTMIFEPAAAMYILIMEYYQDTNSYANLNRNFEHVYDVSGVSD